MKAQNDKEKKFLDAISQNKQIIYKVCYMYASGDEHFKDLYQEVLINIWKGLDGFRGDARISTWIYRTCINTCVTLYRRSQKASDFQSLDLLVNVPGDDTNKGAQLKEMYRLINRLNRMDKAIILLWLDEKSYDEISDITGLSRNNVALRLHRIKAKLIEYGQE